MTAIITQKFRLQQAELFKNSFETNAVPANNTYLFIGKSSPWDNETYPDVPENNAGQENECWNDMIAVKKIDSSNVTYCIPRRNWATNTLYIPYNQNDADLYNHPTAAETQAGIDGGWLAGGVYVVTEDMRVYVCIDNNDGVPTASNGQPTGTSVSVITTSDGYHWKYLYTVSAAETIKYLTDDWVPVKTLTSNDGSNQWAVQAAAVDGAIEYANVVLPGSGYTRTQVNQIATAGSAGDYSLVLSQDAYISDDYYTNCSIYLSNGEINLITGYAGPSKTATVQNAWVTNPTGVGVTYSILPTITVTGDGSGAKIKPVINAGVFIGTEIIAGGSGYKMVGATITDHANGGTGASIEPIIGPKGGLGADPVTQLGAAFIMMNVKLAYNEGDGDFPINNDYRRVGIVHNIAIYDFPETLASATTARVCKQLTLTSVGGTFEPDELFFTSNHAKQGKVIEHLTTDNTLKYYQDLDTGYGVFAISDTISNNDSTATATVGAINNPGIEPYSGDIVYFEQRRPVTRSVDQEEDIKIVVEF